MNVTFIYILGAAVIWLLVIGEFSVRQIIIGTMFAVGFSLITSRRPRRRIPLKELPVRLTYLAIYALVLIPYDIVQSNFDLARRLLRRRPDIHPGIIRIRLGRVSEATSALVAHAITMSPGELVVDYSEDGENIYVHLIDVRDVEKKNAAFWGLYHTVLEKVFS